jgi:L-amino acid N-acyltransferase YncA
LFERSEKPGRAWQCLAAAEHFSLRSNEQTAPLCEEEMTLTRLAIPADAPAIAAIYAHHVRHGTATFDTDPPPVVYWTDKIAELATRNWPFLVAEQDGEVAGYAYATQFRDRPAYARTCEDSVYVRAAWHGRGIGAALLDTLCAAARASGFHEMIAVIGGGEPASVALHAKAGFRHAGRMERVGEKFGRLLDTVYMQRSLNNPA